jgi:nucleoside-diphosphate-sugar epimerase
MDLSENFVYVVMQKADEVLAHTYNHIYGLSITALRLVVALLVIYQEKGMYFFHCCVVNVFLAILFVQVLHGLWPLGQT